MRKKEQNEVWIMWMVKALLAAYVVTGILLIILALALYKFELNEGAVTAGVTAVYLISTFTGGLVVGKLAKVRRFLWGIVLGIIVFCVTFACHSRNLPHISWKQYRDIGDICVVCGRRHGRRNDILRKGLRNLY